jgi:hypothetical protein
MAEQIWRQEQKQNYGFIKKASESKNQQAQTAEEVARSSP